MCYLDEYTHGAYLSTAAIQHLIGRHNLSLIRYQYHFWEGDIVRLSNSFSYARYSDAFPRLPPDLFGVPRRSELEPFVQLVHIETVVEKSIAAT